MPPLPSLFPNRRFCIPLLKTKRICLPLDGHSFENGHFRMFSAVGENDLIRIFPCHCCLCYFVLRLIPLYDLSPLFFLKLFFVNWLFLWQWHWRIHFRGGFQALPFPFQGKFLTTCFDNKNAYIAESFLTNQHQSDVLINIMSSKGRVNW